MWCRRMWRVPTKFCGKGIRRGRYLYRPRRLEAGFVNGKDVDLVYVCTHWDLHTPIGVYAMEQGKHVALEVPALTVDECWQLVNTAEKTRRHCIQLENCNYDFFEMATLNMAQQGVFGEIVHTRAPTFTI